MSDTLKFEYIAPKDAVKRHMWTVVGSDGGIHIWAEPLPGGFNRGGEKFYGGVEIHSKTRLYSFGDGSPDNDDCWLLGCPCWHDGTSLYFSERLEPFIRHEEEPFGPNVHELMNAVLYDWYHSKLSLRAEEVEGKAA